MPTPLLNYDDPTGLYLMDTSKATRALNWGIMSSTFGFHSVGSCLGCYSQTAITTLS